MSRKPNITISYDDLREIEDQLNKIVLPAERIDELSRELIKAKVVNAKDLSPDVITIGSQVTFKISHFDKYLTRTLCLPLDVGKYDDGMSVFAPVGSALLGLRAGQNITWRTQTGEQRLDVLEVKRKVKYFICD